MSRTVFAMARTEAEAECMLTELRRLGFPSDAASVLFPDKRGKRHFGYERHSKAPELGALGALAGGIVGAIIGHVLNNGWLDMPGGEHVSTAGPLFGTMTCVAVVAALFGLVGALIGLHMPEYEAKRMDAAKKPTGILVSVHCEGLRQAVLARQVFSSYGSKDIDITPAVPVPA